MGIVTNATERKNLEAELREREEQHRSLFEATTDALLVFDRDGTIVEANPAACRLLGYSYRELVGLSSESITHPDNYHLFEKLRRQAHSGERSSTQLVSLRRDGTTVDVEVRGDAISFKGKPHVLVVALDITDLVRAYHTLEQEVAKQVRELHTLLDVSAAASSSLALDEMLSTTLNRLVHLVGAAQAGVLLRDKNSSELTLRMMCPSRSIAEEDLSSLINLGSTVIASTKPLYARGREPIALLPLRSRGRTLGVLSIVGIGDSNFSNQQTALFEAIADQLGVAIGNARLYEQAEQAAVLQERQRLARELHDSVTQSLYSVTLFAEVARRLAAAGDVEHSQDYLARLGETAQDALKELRLLVYELRPWALEREGLVGALQERLDAVEKRAGIEWRLLVKGTVTLPPAVEEGLYRIAQEALNNALKHAAATTVTIWIRADGERVELEVLDNGRGFSLDAVSKRGGVGLLGMRERAERLRGSLTVTSTPGKGTTVRVQVETRGSPGHLSRPYNSC